jgi:hypothetical protein
MLQVADELVYTTDEFDAGVALKQPDRIRNAGASMARIASSSQALGAELQRVRAAQGW